MIIQRHFWNPVIKKWDVFEKEMPDDLILKNYEKYPEASMKFVNGAFNEYEDVARTEFLLDYCFKEERKIVDNLTYDTVTLGLTNLLIMTIQKQRFDLRDGWVILTSSNVVNKIRTELYDYTGFKYDFGVAEPIYRLKYLENDIYEAVIETNYLSDVLAYVQVVQSLESKVILYNKNNYKLAWTIEYAV